jgi:hypothetical protein
MEKLSLNNVDVIPAESTGLMVFGPTSDFSERDIKLLSDYWNHKGRLFIFLNPLGQTPRLDEWLSKQGITAQRDRVLKTGMKPEMNENNQLVLRNGIMLASGIFIPGARSITREVAGENIDLLGATESLKLDNGKAAEQGAHLTPLLESGQGFWGETELEGTTQIYFDANKDHAGPLTLAAAAEKGGIEDQRVKVDTARMIVTGNSGFITNDGLRLSGVGLDFILNAINWAFNREVIAGIPPKPKEMLKLSIDEQKMDTLALTVLLYIPACVGVIGFLVWGERNDRLWWCFLILLGITAVVVALYAGNLWLHRTPGLPS